MSTREELLYKLRAVRVFFTDVDGVWTDGSITVHPDGSESATFCVLDGLGLKRAMQTGLSVVVISGRNVPAVRVRAQRLGIHELHLGSTDKGPLVRKILRSQNLSQEQAAAMGDDLPDLEMFSACGVRVAPPNAVAEVKKASDYITQAGGGRGAVREFCDLWLAARIQQTADSESATSRPW